MQPTPELVSVVPVVVGPEVQIDCAACWRSHRRPPDLLGSPKLAQIHLRDLSQEKRPTARTFAPMSVDGCAERWTTCNTSSAIRQVECADERRRAAELRRPASGTAAGWWDSARLTRPARADAP
jgi:hypothetical protein